ncbi:MAG: YfhO family protein [Gammaproteobacteria bacterium]|nr:YfhO family protein [Gammaproteobacteria bacterium]
MTIREFGAGGRAFLAFHGFPLLVFIALATAFLGDVLFTDKSLAAFDIILSQPNWYSEYPIHGVHQGILLDSPTAHYPQRMHDWSAVRHGINATYNPYIFAGMPWSPQGVGAFLTSLPQLVLDVPNALDWSTWLRLILAGFFMYLFLVELGLSRASSTFGGLVWAYNLHQIVWLQFPQHLATQLWIPMLLLANLWILQRGFRREYVLALILVNVLFFTSGYTQIVLYTYIAVGLFNTLYLSLLAQGPVRVRAKCWCLIHLIFIGAALFYAAGIYSEMRFINEGLRGVQEFRGQVADLELHWGLVLAFVKSLFPAIEEIRRFYTPDYYGGIWGGNYYDPNHGNVVESSAYIGAMTVLFGLAAILALRSTRRRSTVVLFLVLLGVFFSTYHQNGLTISMLNLIPLADKGSYGRFITLVIFFGCVLAAFGLQEVGERWTKSHLGLIFGAVGLFFIFPILGRVFDPTLDLAAFSHPFLIIGLLALVVLAFIPPAGRRWMLPVVMIAITVGDLFYATYAFNTRMSNDRIFPTNNVIRFLLNDPAPYRIAVLSEQPLYRSNLLSYYRIPTAEGYSTVLPNRYAKYIDASLNSYHITPNGMLFLFEPNIKALRLMNIKYVLSDRVLQEPGLEKVLESNNHYVYRIRDWLARAYCASDIVVKPKKDTIYKKLRGAIASFDRPALVTSTIDAVAGGQCDVDDLEVFVHGASFTVTAPTERLIVLPYAFVGGWQAWVDDQRVAVVPVNAAFLGVPVPAGVSRVTVRYRNIVDTVGAAILIAGALGLILLLLSLPVKHFAHGIMILVALTVVGKSALSLSWVAHKGVPERNPPAQPLSVELMGVNRDQSARPSTRIGPGKSITAALGVYADGLTKLGFKAAIYLQPQLPYDLMVVLHDGSGHELARQRVTGEHIIDNGWFFVDIPTLEAPAETEVTVKISAVSTPKQPFSLWLDDTGRPAVRAFYERKPAREL